MRLALLFSGQGGQRPEHWRQLSVASEVPWRPALSGVLPAIDDPAAGDDPEWLSRNRVAQPLIFAHQMLYWGRLQAVLPRPLCAAGYSLGEMAACCAAGAFSVADGVRLCSERAELMDGAAPGEHAMLAVLGLDDALVRRIAAETGLDIAIRNAPRHLVVAGLRAAVQSAAERFATAGASRLVQLPVRTPSHTPRLARAALAFGQRLGDLADTRLAFPVLSAIDGRPARTGRAALAALAHQIDTPLDWAACLQAVCELQPDAVLEIGPGNALSRLFAELAPGIPVRASDEFRSLAGIEDWLRRCA